MIGLKTLSDTMRGLIEAASQMQNDAPSEAQLEAIVERGEFRPAEDEAIGFWFARFLSIRESLWVVIEDVQAELDEPENQLDELRYFLLGYSAACVLVRIDRLLLFEVADHSIIQRKLNEAFPEYRIPRKQYTRIFSAFVDNMNVLALYDAMKYRRKHRKELILLSTDPVVGFLARQLRELETSLDPSKRNYLKGAWRYVSHKWRRRGVVSAQNVMASVMEGVGRVASEIVEKTNKNVTEDVLESIAAFLQPGDVIITRHAKALTNLFMPGFWPHAAFYVGAQERRDPEMCVLEARKDGVLFRPLHDTLSVDAFVVLRPNLNESRSREPSCMKARCTTSTSTFLTLIARTGLPLLRRPPADRPRTKMCCQQSSSSTSPWKRTSHPLTRICLLTASLVYCWPL